MAQAKSQKRKPPGGTLFTRPNGIKLWVGAAVIFCALVAVPPSNAMTRLAEVLLAGGLASGLLALWWRYPVLRWSLLALFALLTGFASLPGRATYDRIALRQDTARAYQRYESARYYSGGEGLLGMDAHGLVRRGFIDALFLHGVSHANPLLVRKAALLWWHDLSSRDLANGAYGSARSLKDAKSIRDLDVSRLDPGDFAVTRDNAQTLAFLGGHLWLAADPDHGKVIRLDDRAGGASLPPWSQDPMKVLRWRMLDLERHVGRQP